MPFTKFALNKYFSQEISQLTECNAPSIVKLFSQSENWVANFFLNSVFGSSIDQNQRAFGFGFLRRAETAFLEYEMARNFLIDFINNSPNKPSLYLKSLTHFEISISMVYQAYQLLMSESSDKLFVKNDGSPIQKLNTIYNSFRHFKPSNLPPNHFHVMWISNNGLQIENCDLSFNELEEIMIEIGNLADRISKICKD